MTETTRHSKATRKYLETWAEPTNELVGERSFGHVIVIPAYGEAPDFLRQFEQLEGPLGKPLVLVVINARADSPRWVHEANDRLREAVSQVSWSDRLAVIDHVLPPGAGVGLARKLGGDAALRLWAAGRIRSRWMHCTDADVSLPADYLERSADVRDAAALVYPFVHVPEEPELTEPLRQYDLHLRYYVAGLEYAGSPYAFHSVGSTMAIDFEHYAQVRGFPGARAAAEDFYMLNKLAKVAAIHSLDGPPIVIAGRVSDRVPFGTGATMQASVQEDAPVLTYDPRVFDFLAQWLRTRSAEGAVLAAVLDTLGPVPDFTGGDADRHFHTWFDGFRTLRFVHLVRDQGYPSMPVADAVERATFFRI